MRATGLNYPRPGAVGGSRGQLFNRQNFLIALLFLILLITTALQQQGEEEVLYDPASAGPLGLRGLLLWLDELGYAVAETGVDAFPIELFEGSNRTNSAGRDRVDLLFVYPNSLPYTELEAQTVYQWVAAGGTLVLIGPSVADQMLEEAFGVQMVEPTFAFDAESDEQPLLPDGQDDVNGFGQGDHLVLGDAPQSVPVLSTQSRPDDLDVCEVLFESGEAQMHPRTATVAVQSIGAGLVWHLASRHDFTNIALRNEREAGLLPPLLRTIPDGGRVLLDTYHLFATSKEEIASIQAWFYQTAAGQAIIFALLAIFGYLLLQGRRLGPPLPATEANRRREAAEYVRAMAGLQQRSQQTAAVAQYHERRLRTALAQRYATSTALSDQDFWTQIEQTTTGPTDEELQMIRQLRNTLSAEPSEAALIEAVGQIDEIIESK